MRIEFQGSVQCQSMKGPVSLLLRGRWRDAPTDVLFCAPPFSGLPSTLDEVRLTELPSEREQRKFRIDSAQTQFEFDARSAQLHRAVGELVFAAVPPARVPLTIRAGWMLLLTALRFPGAGRLLQRRRASP